MNDRDKVGVSPQQQTRDSDGYVMSQEDCSKTTSAFKEDNKTGQRRKKRCPYSYCFFLCNSMLVLYVN